jgi:hypothetical protein
MTHEQRINSALALAAARRGYRQDSVCTHTPLDDLIEAEEAAQRGEIEPSVVVNRFLDFVWADGPHPGHLLRRCIAIAKGFQRDDLLRHMTLAELGMMLGETRAAQSWRVKKIFAEYRKRSGAKQAYKARFQKTEEASLKYARAQRGNTNNRGKYAA